MIYRDTFEGREKEEVEWMASSVENGVVYANGGRYEGPEEGRRRETEAVWNCVETCREITQKGEEERK